MRHPLAIALAGGASCYAAGCLSAGGDHVVATLFSIAGMALVGHVAARVSVTPPEDDDQDAEMVATTAVSSNRRDDFETCPCCGAWLESCPCRFRRRIESEDHPAGFASEIVDYCVVHRGEK